MTQQPRTASPAGREPIDDSGQAGVLGERRIGEIIRESFSIGGWVAMWRPLEVFLYDWWPIRAEARLAERLSAMPVRIDYASAARSDAWRSDWPAAAPETRQTGM